MNALLSIAILLDTGSGQNLIKKELLPAAWRESVKLISALQLQSANG